jgi:uncharacterized coiled-coil DUF342 family protein
MEDRLMPHDTTIDTTTKAMERRCLTLDNVMGDEALEELRATLRALAAERDALVAREDERNEAADAQIVELEAERDAARAECVAMASQLQEAQAQVARLRRGWLTTIQVENSCAGSGKPCDAKRCGCIEEMEMLLREDDERAALTEAPRHD